MPENTAKGISPITSDTETRDGIVHFKGVMVNEDLFYLGDTVYLKNARNARLPYIARIVDIYAEYSKVMIRISWFWRRQDVPKQRVIPKVDTLGFKCILNVQRLVAREVFVAEPAHTDVNDAECIDGRCLIVRREDFLRVTHKRSASWKGLPRLSEALRNVHFCSWIYNVENGFFSETDAFPALSTSEALNLRRLQWDALTGNASFFDACDVAGPYFRRKSEERKAFNENSSATMARASSPLSRRVSGSPFFMLSPRSSPSPRFMDRLDASSSPVERGSSRVGDSYQAGKLPSPKPLSEPRYTAKAPGPHMLWDPSIIEESQLVKYLQECKKFGDSSLVEEAALKLLMESNGDPAKALDALSTQSSLDDTQRILQPSEGSSGIGIAEQARIKVDKHLGSPRLLDRHSSVPRDFMDPLWALKIATSLDRRLLPYRAAVGSKRKILPGTSPNSQNQNDDICAICRCGGILLCCDGCDSAFHLGCIGLRETPSEDEWLCVPCRQLRLFSKIGKKTRKPAQCL